MTVRGTDIAVVREAVAMGDPLPGGWGFAGELDGLLVRDVLGRVPLFLEGADAPEAAGPKTDARDTDVAEARDLDTGERRRDWAFRPSDLDEPVPVPAGTATDRAALVGRTDGADRDDGEPVVADGFAFDRRWHLPDPAPERDHEAATAALDGAIRTAVDAVDRGDREVAVAFSGGVDSALVAELLDAPLYVVGFPDSHDVAAARSAAEAMGREVTVVELDPADLARAAPAVARAIGRTNAMDVGIALPLYLVGERVAADGFDALAVGQGADELFGGYEKVVHLDHRVDADTTRGAVRETIATLPSQLARDALAIDAAGLDPVVPFLHDAVVDAALRLPDDLLADEAVRKRALRRVARRYLPASVAERDKKAVQYGSLVARELDRLARQNGFKRRIGDHVTKYVASLLEGE